MPRTLSQIAKEQKVIAKMYFNKPYMKSKSEPFHGQEPIRYAKKFGSKKPKLGKMLGEV